MGNPQARTQTGSPPDNENLKTIVPVRFFYSVVDIELLSTLIPDHSFRRHHAARSWKGLRPHRQEPPTTYCQAPGASPPTLHLSGEQGSERLRKPCPKLSHESRCQSKPRGDQRESSSLWQL